MTFADWVHAYEVNHDGRCSGNSPSTFCAILVQSCSIPASKQGIIKKIVLVSRKSLSCIDKPTITTIVVKVYHYI